MSAARALCRLSEQDGRDFRHEEQKGDGDDHERCGQADAVAVMRAAGRAAPPAEREDVADVDDLVDERGGAHAGRGDAARGAAAQQNGMDELRQEADEEDRQDGEDDLVGGAELAAQEREQAYVGADVITASKVVAPRQVFGHIEKARRCCRPVGQEGGRHAAAWHGEYGGGRAGAGLKARSRGREGPEMRSALRNQVRTILDNEGGWERKGARAATAGKGRMRDGSGRL